jgi:hypothetical protein
LKEYVEFASRKIVRNRFIFSSCLYFTVLASFFIVERISFLNFIFDLPVALDNLHFFLKEKVEEELSERHSSFSLIGSKWNTTIPLLS